jgi:nicotinate-nucleotide--dimethylbenzimidazole phosphoribosyltransferase
MISTPELEAAVLALAGEVQPVDREAEAAARERHERLTKPSGSLGKLEALGVRLAGIAGRCPPPVPARSALVVAAGDHGVLAHGVSPWPQEVTAQMVAGIVGGTAAASVLARVVGAELVVLDVGVATPLAPHPRVRRAKVRPGTADLASGPAMTRDEAARALLAGAKLAGELLEAGVDLLLTGDMGIANTTPAACLAAAFTGRPAAAVTGRGTGIDDATLARKVGVVEQALARHRPDPADPLGVLAAVGGLEHAALVGVCLAGAAQRVPVLLDGVSANAAALVACALSPAAAGYLVAGHRSTEPAAGAALDHLGLEPLLRLDLRLGEGTGALLAAPIVRAAAAVLAEMATFDDAGIATPAPAAPQASPG